MDIPDTDIVLTVGDFALTTSPYGASLRGLTHGGQPVVTGYSGAHGKMGGQGDVLIPFPGRVADGRYTFNGASHQMERNDKDGPNAIHGFVRTKIWDVLTQTADSITYAVSLAPDEAPGYPFALSVEITYSLTGDGMACRFSVQNAGTEPAPVAAGFHPYFTVGSDTIDGDTLRVPFASVLEFNSVLIPTGRVLPVETTPFDFCTAHAIGDTVFNTCYLHPVRNADGMAHITLSNSGGGRTVTVGMDAAFDYVVIYSGDPMPDTHRRRALAIEPMTCASDGFNHPEWGLASVAPGETLSGTWAVSCSH